MSSRGRVGVRAGPFSYYGGGRRRKSPGCLTWLLVIALAIGLILALVEALARVWYYSIPAALVLAYVWGKLAARAKRRREARYGAWLAGPAPRLSFPGRFTQSWFQRNGPTLHPGHIGPLLAELRRRGWSETDIASRAEPYFPAFPDAT